MRRSLLVKGETQIQDPTQVHLLRVYLQIVKHRPCSTLTTNVDTDLSKARAHHRTSSRQ